MNKIFSLVTAILLSITATAQTNFRNNLSYEEVFKVAKQEGKLVFLDFYTDWCGPCKAMAKNEFTKPKVGEYMNRHFVNVQINGEKGEGPTLIEKYQLTGYPTMFVLDADKNIIMTIHSYKDGEELVRLIDNKLDTNKSLPRLIERYQGGERGDEFISLLCESLKKSEGLSLIERKENTLKAHDIAQGFFANIPDSLKLLSKNQWPIWQYTMFSEDQTIQFLKKMNTFSPQTHKGYDPRMNMGFEQLIQTTYEDDINKYLSGEKKYEQQSYETYRKAFADMQLYEKIENCDVAFEFIEAYGKGNIDSWIDYCNHNFQRLDKKQMHTILLNFGQLMLNSTDEQKNKALQMLRNQLPIMDTQSMYYVTSIAKTLFNK